MKCPTLIASIARDLAKGHAAVVQIVSTGEALLDRRLTEIPQSEWSDVQVDVTPREYVLDYLQHSFPIQLFEIFSDEDGNLSSRPVLDEHGQPFTVDADGLLAVCIQHEIDHLDGKVFVQYLSRLKQSRIRTRMLKAEREAA